MKKLNSLLIYLCARAAEPSTWQGIAFFAGAAGSHYAALDPGYCALVGGILSGALKILLPDSQPNKE